MQHPPFCNNYLLSGWTVMQCGYEVRLHSHYNFLAPLSQSSIFPIFLFGGEEGRGALE